MAATFQEVKDELATIKANIAASLTLAQQQVAQIAALQAQIAAGSPVTQAQLNELDATADEIIVLQGGTPPVPPDQV